jgi:DNA-binding CsgD family transcriptional regulator
MFNDPEARVIDKETTEKLHAQAEEVLSKLTPREALVLRLRFGIADGEEHTYTELAGALGLSRSSVVQIESRALRKLRQPSRGRLLQPYLDMLEDQPSPADAAVENLLFPAVEVKAVIEAVDQLTPELLQHLRGHGDDLEKLPWEVYEHLVGEFLASQGFEDVRLVGRDPSTSADIYAARSMRPLAVYFRLFVEVKRWQDKVGIEVITKVIGALLSERPRYGWHAALVVSKVGFTQMKKFNRPELTMLGIDLKQKEDLLMWLADYKPSASGLWLPSPKRHMPKPAR